MIRHLVRLESLALFVLFLIFYRTIAPSNLLWSVVLFFTPDIAMLGYLLNKKTGDACYNLTHNQVLPLAVLLLCLPLKVTPAIPAYCVLWLAHIHMDRMLGLGLKYWKQPFRETHIQRL